jgi:uncharacterized protein (TIGR04255 family)
MSESAFPKLSRPPLREALVDLRLRDDLPVSFLAKLEAPRGFPVNKEMKQGQFQLKLEKDRPFEAEVVKEEVFGRRYEKEDGSEVVQLRRNGLTHSILKNYTSGDVLMETARNSWQHFLAVSGPVNVSRLAVRYINSIEVPLGADFDEYLTAGPRIPNPLPQILNGFLQRVVVPFADDGANAIITQAMEGPTAGNIPVVLDIDVLCDCSLEGASAEIWSRLDKLRSIKNRVFFSSLSPKMINSYI